LRKPYKDRIALEFDAIQIVEKSGDARRNICIRTPMAIWRELYRFDVAEVVRPKIAERKSTCERYCAHASNASSRHDEEN